MGLSQEKLRELYLEQNPINDFKVGDVIQYVPENIAIERKFVIKAYMDLVKPKLNDKIIVKNITYDIFGEYGKDEFEVIQHINIPTNNNMYLTSSHFFMYDRKTKIKKLLQLI